MGLLKVFLGSLLSLLIISGGPLVYYFDHHFAGWSAEVGPKIPLIPCCRLKLSIPPGMAVRDAQKLADADSRALAYQGRAKALSASLALQNAAVDRLSKAGDKARADLIAAGEKYRRDLAASKKRESVILALGDGPGDVCTRAAAVDKAFLDSLQ